MKHHVKTFTATIEYDEFEPGDIIKPKAPASLANRYVVKEFRHPGHAGDKAILFVEGREVGEPAENYVLADDSACLHPTSEVLDGPRTPLRYGTGPTQVCCLCGAYRVALDPRSPGPWLDGPVPTRRREDDDE